MHNCERQKHRHNLLRLPRQSNCRQLTRQIVVAKTSHSCCRCFSCCCLSLANRFDYNNECNLLTLHLSRFNISLAFISAFLLFHCVAYFWTSCTFDWLIVKQISNLLSIFSNANHMRVVVVAAAVAKKKQVAITESRLRFFGVAAVAHPTCDLQAHNTKQAKLFSQQLVRLVVDHILLSLCWVLPNNLNY